MTANQPGIFKRRRDIPTELLAVPDPLNLIRCALLDWATILILWLLMASLPQSFFYVGVLLVAGRLHALGVILHDACHIQRGVLPSWLVFSLQILAGYPITTTLEAMRYHHLRHHNSSGMATDPYFKPGASDRWLPALLGRLRGLLLPPVWILRSYFGCLALFLPSLRNAYGRVFLGDRSGKDLRSHPELLLCLQAEIGQAVFFLLLMLFSLQNMQTVMYYYGLPLLIAGVLNANRIVCEHIHIANHDRCAATIVATTLTHDWGLIGRLFMFPRNIGFHTVHHLHPFVSMEKLPELHQWYLNHEPAYRSGNLR